MFDVTLDGFRDIRQKAEDLLQQAIKYAFPTALRPYLSKSQWMTVGEPLDSRSLSIRLAGSITNAYTVAYLASLTTTPELDQPLQVCLASLFTRKKLTSSTDVKRKPIIPPKHPPLSILPSRLASSPRKFRRAPMERRPPETRLHNCRGSSPSSGFQSHTKRYRFIFHT